VNQDVDARPSVVWPNGRRWLAYAACAGADTELFFRADGQASEEALRICSRCSVRGECLAFALAKDEWTGVWGGRDAASRRSLKRPTSTPIDREEGSDGSQVA
jgi:WhiB family redox-sensing transcriptional regulator